MDEIPVCEHGNLDGVAILQQDPIRRGDVYKRQPIVFEPKGELAQYCICSPIADENGVIYFKNDTGNMMACLLYTS